MRAPNRSVRVLLLSGACLVGQNVLSSLSGRRSGIGLYATGSVATEPVLFDFDAAYLTPSVRDDPAAFATRFAEVLAQCEPNLVIPCRDDDVCFLAEWLDRNPNQQTRHLCGSSIVARAMRDKLESRRFSQEHGLPFAPTLSTRAGTDALQHFAGDHGFPLVAKPCEGFGSRDVRLILNKSQLQRIAMRPGYVLQQYLGDRAEVLACADGMANNGLPLFHSVEGVKISIQASIAPDGAIAGVFVTRNTMGQGRSESVEPANDPEIDRLARHWTETFSRAGWRGALNIQCKRSETGEIMIFEYNGRFTGATAARYLLGFDEIGTALREWLGYRLPDGAQSGAVRVVRYPVGRALDAEKVEQLRGKGFWATTAVAFP